MAWSALSGPRCIGPLPFKDKRLACADRHGGICSGSLGKSFYETYWMMQLQKQATERSKWTHSPRPALSKPPRWSCAFKTRMVNQLYTFMTSIYDPWIFMMQTNLISNEKICIDNTFCYCVMVLFLMGIRFPVPSFDELVFYMVLLQYMFAELQMHPHYYL